MRDKIAKYLNSAQVMQLANESNGQPWVCSVYFVTDVKLNFYWLSLPSRRHSEELINNPRAAIAVVIKHDLPVIGLQAEGKVAKETDPQVVHSIMKRYVTKYKTGYQFFDRFKAGKNNHVLYKFIPNRIVLFDEEHNPDKPQEEYIIN